jgi:hypothetical protein
MRRPGRGERDRGLRLQPAPSATAAAAVAASHDSRGRGPYASLRHCGRVPLQPQVHVSRLRVCRARGTGGHTQLVLEQQLQNHSMPTSCTTASSSTRASCKLCAALPESLSERRSLDSRPGPSHSTSTHQPSSSSKRLSPPELPAAATGPGCAPPWPPPPPVSAPCPAICRWPAVVERQRRRRRR